MTGAARAVPRSILYTPALSLERVVKAWSYDADVHLIDLEDSVPPAGKPPPARCAGPRWRRRRNRRTSPSA
ncbi:hypothetical protein LUX12_20195 [Streptomyces somaliensis]|nr:hypothetical protein [Streptomyces somaliensis]